MARKARGFTLIELMVSVAIVGILSSVAIPNFKLSTLRARKAERDMILDGVNRSMQSILIRQGKFGATSVGDWNPAGTPTAQKRAFNYGAAGWKDLDLQIQGHVYHRFYFFADESVNPTTLDIWAEGDLDGDGVVQRKQTWFVLKEGALLERQADTYTPAGDVAF